MEEIDKHFTYKMWNVVCNHCQVCGPGREWEKIEHDPTCPLYDKHNGWKIPSSTGYYYIPGKIINTYD